MSQHTSSHTRTKLPELLVPAGNPEKLETAILYGADAVYLGGKALNLRASAQGFSVPELQQGVNNAHAKGVSIYYCLNSLPKEQDLQSIPLALEEAATAGVDGLIIADPGIFRMARKITPHLPVHVSTQANTANSESVAFWGDLGASRVNLAREMSARDIYSAKKALHGVETEVFIHGAMCLAVSGKCLMSSWLNERPANMGRCTHPCRFEYRELHNYPHDTSCSHGCLDTTQQILSVEEKTRPGEPVWHVTMEQPEHPTGTAYSSIWAPQDLCLMPYLPWFIQNEITAVKIEGRMKGAGYVAHVTDAYRTALSSLQNKAEPFDFAPYMWDLFSTASRPLGTGFFLPNKRRNFNEELKPTSTGNSLVAKLLEQVDDSTWVVDVRGKWEKEASVEVMLPGMKRPKIHPASMESMRGEKVDAIHSGTKARICLNATDAEIIAKEAVPGIFIRSTQK